MYNIDQENRKLIERYSRKIRIFNIVGLVVLCVVFFVQKEFVVKLLTLFTLLVVYLMMKSSFRTETNAIKSIKKREYKLIETKINDFEYINQEIDEYKPSRELKFMTFEDCDLLYEIEKTDKRFSVGDSVVVQIVDNNGKECIINVINLE